ncbi:ABC transporter permease, partial [Streptomyces sp. NPDC050982]
MSQATAPATSSSSPAPPAAPKDGRTSERSLTRRLAARPEIGALIAAIAVYVFFFAVASPFREAGSLANVLYESSVMGIMALPVALLMIGGEFDLSAGVAVTTSALTASMWSFQLSMNVWVGVGVALVVSLAIGAFNGYLLVRTGLPSFLITLGSFLILQGGNLAITKIFTGNVATDSISDMDGFDQAKQVFASEISIGGVDVKITVFYWFVFAAAATWLLLRT